MVSYYNSLSYPQKHSSTNLPYTTVQPWSWQTNYPPPNQFVGDVDSPHSMSHHPMQYYNPHMFSSTSTADWHSAENFAQTHLLQQHHHQHYQHHQQQQQQPQNTGGTLNDRNNNNAGDTSATEILPSPPITVSGSEMSSPGGTALSSSPHPNMSANANSNKTSAGVSNSNNPGNNTINSVNIPSGQSSPDKSSPFYDWMKKPTYSSHPMPGKTRTKDKYRVVYTDFQRLELEKEYCTSRYITIRRKSELAQALILSERQVKIWFQNRRAKERKQHKKREDMSLAQHPDLASYIDTKPKLEPGIHHLQHSLHSMTMNMPMSLHHHHSMLHHGHHHPLGVPPPPQHHLHQPPLPLSQSAPTPGPSTVSLHNSSPPM